MASALFPDRYSLNHFAPSGDEVPCIVMASISYLYGFELSATLFPNYSIWASIFPFSPNCGSTLLFPTLKSTVTVSVNLVVICDCPAATFIAATRKANANICFNSLICNVLYVCMQFFATKKANKHSNILSNILFFSIVCHFLINKMSGKNHVFPGHKSAGAFVYSSIISSTESPVHAAIISVATFLAFKLPAVSRIASLRPAALPSANPLAIPAANPCSWALAIWNFIIFLLSLSVIIVLTYSACSFSSGPHTCQYFSFGAT